MTPRALPITPMFMQITFCLYPRFSNHCLANALEPLRAANDLSGKPLYRWTIVSPIGAPVRSSSGIEIAPDMSLEVAEGDTLFVMCSYGHDAFLGPAQTASLRRAAGRHGVVAGLDTGAYVMAAAGLLSGRRATVHWDEFDAFSDHYPDVTAVSERVVRDGNRWTCGGATTAFDLVLDLIEEQHGASLRLEVAGLFMHGEWRGKLPNRPSGEARVDAAVALMRRHVRQPQKLPDIAKAVGLSPRRLEALFAERFQDSPRRVYQDIRLTEAKRLLTQTTLSVGEIAARCGYEDPSAMGRAFKTRFTMSPSEARQARPKH
ncbi:MAG: GlxA family transcriptional regulator [Marinovum sp.]|nr:GlxA family transcriptional regulator [Marinovum sp.]